MREWTPVCDKTDDNAVPTLITSSSTNIIYSSQSLLLRFLSAACKKTLPTFLLEVVRSVLGYSVREYHKLKVRQAVGSVFRQLLCPLIMLLFQRASHCLLYTVNREPWLRLSGGREGVMGGLLCTRCRLIRCLPGEISSVTRAGN